MFWFSLLSSALAAVCTLAVAPALAAGITDEPLRIESNAVQPPRCETLPVPSPAERPPVVNVADFGAVGDGLTDDSDALNRALDSMRGGGTLRLEPGKTYLKRKIVVVMHPGVRIWGYGASLNAITSEAEIERGKGHSPLSIYLKGADTGVYGLTIVSNLRKRLVGHPSDSAIYLAGPRQEAIDNRIEYTGIGILAEGATDFLIARNVVYRTSADAIHVTDRSRHGRIRCNAVRESGDDMVAVVNYGAGAPTIDDFLIEANDVSGQYWGRGIAVVGGRNVTIRKNSVARTTHGAGIYVTAESAWGTTDIEDIVVDDNVVSDVQTTPAAYNPIATKVKTGQGGIHIEAARGPHKVRRVVIRNNWIRRAAKDGVYIGGDVQDVTLEANRIERVGRRAVFVEHQGPVRIGCTGNSLDGKAIEQDKCSQ